MRLAINLPRYSDIPAAAGGASVVNKFMSLFNPDNPDITTGFIVSRVLLFAIISAGLVFFVKLIFSGYTYLTSLGEPAKIQAATKELTNAAIGLIVVISTFFIAQILQVVFGITILW